MLSVRQLATEPSLSGPGRAARTAVDNRSAIPTWHSAPDTELTATASTSRSAAASSDPK
ncbi:hypothetical protein MAHJHV28_46060 [Mycobacterium avium subsp. hominissuis]